MTHANARADVASRQLYIKHTLICRVFQRLRQIGAIIYDTFKAFSKAFDCFNNIQFIKKAAEKQIE